MLIPSGAVYTSPLLRHRQPVHLNLEEMIDADAVDAVRLRRRFALGFRAHYYAVDHEVHLVRADTHFEGSLELRQRIQTSYRKTLPSMTHRFLSKSRLRCLLTGSRGKGIRSDGI
jgi:hypothetical protein